MAASYYKIVEYGMSIQIYLWNRSGLLINGKNAIEFRLSD